MSLTYACSMLALKHICFKTSFFYIFMCKSMFGLIVVFKAAEGGLMKPTVAAGRLQ